jgi:ubiquinone/menaquinone biosynthesis C-methylase UbiE
VSANPIVEAYSRLAREYDDDSNLKSCWGLASERAVSSVRLRDDCGVVLDIGCGTGRAMRSLQSTARPGVRFVGIDPAPNMCHIAAQRTLDLPGVQILQGSFEKIPLATRSVDYLYSIFAFHWVTDLAASVSETARVLKPSAEMDLFFIGRDNGAEFIRQTSPIFLKYLGPALFLDSARLRKQLTRTEALQVFSEALSPERLSVQESYVTYYDALEGHLSWWVRIEGQFLKIPPEKRGDCDREVREALRSLEGAQGIPYTIHELHVRLNRAGNVGRT